MAMVFQIGKLSSGNSLKNMQLRAGLLKGKLKIIAHPVQARQ